MATYKYLNYKVDATSERQAIEKLRRRGVNAEYAERMPDTFKTSGRHKAYASASAMSRYTEKDD